MSVFAVNKLGKMPEILAPAGSFEAVEAAVRCSADAVYLGAKQFSARASAQNFDLDELKKTIAYCHDRDVKVHLALNTAVYDRELKSAAELIEACAKEGIDALIVSDLGILSLAKEICPTISLHASTQMSIGSLSGAQTAKMLGFDRAVLAREMSMDEIFEISKKNIIETEVFIHGALCMCVSGQCYLSSVIGKRSGNRGRCAQPCRQNCGINTPEGYALSLKDLSLCSHLNELSQMGVTSLKIEGRMKRPEYVAAAVSLARASLLSQDTSELFELCRDVFSRSGFTDGYFSGNIDKKMFGIRSREDIDDAKNALPRIHNLYRRELQRIPLDAEIKICENEPALLTLCDNKGNCAEVVGEKAVSGSVLDAKFAEQKLSKLGTTPYFLNSFKSEIKSATITSASLSELKARAVEILKEKRTMPPEIKTHTPKELKAPEISRQQQKLISRFESLEQANASVDLCDQIILPIREILKSVPKLDEGVLNKITAELDRFAFSNDEFTKNALKAIKQMGIKRVCLQNIGQLALINKDEFEITFGAFMNTVNSRALKLLSDLGVKGAIASFELSQRSICELKPFVQIGTLVYGYIPLMMTRACPKKSVSDCKACKGSSDYLVDRKGAKMKIVCRGAVSEIYNSVPLSAKIENDEHDEADFLLCYFTIEDKKRCREILLGIKSGKSPDCSEGFTRGLYKNGAI